MTYSSWKFTGKADVAGLGSLLGTPALVGTQWRAVIFQAFPLPFTAVFD